MAWRPWPRAPWWRCWGSFRAAPGGKGHLPWAMEASSGASKWPACPAELWPQDTSLSPVGWAAEVLGLGPPSTLGAMIWHQSEAWVRVPLPLCPWCSLALCRPLGLGSNQRHSTSEHDQAPKSPAQTQGSRGTEVPLTSQKPDSKKRVCREGPKSRQCEFSSLGIASGGNGLISILIKLLTND